MDSDVTLRRVAEMFGDEYGDCLKIKRELEDVGNHPISQGLITEDIEKYKRAMEEKYSPERENVEYMKEQQRLARKFRR